jgi:flagellar basal-body rod modification protein FlgD
MEITPTTATAAAATAARQTEQAESAGALAADFQTFLTLLTTQMRNQDPLKPMESTEFVAQLATFSGVEQQVRSNDRLDAILEVLGGGAAGLAEWIGREVRAPAKAAFAGDPVEVGMTPVEGADKAWLVVRNDFDQVVARLPVDPAAESVEWSGADDMGKPLAHGDYGFAIESYAGETLLGTQAGTVFSKVSEVRVADGQQVLVLEDGSRVTLGDVTAVR